MQNNIVEYFSGHDGYRCGYCKSTDTNFSHGMWAHSVTPLEYENLLNKGWRRSGKYLYKPTNHRTCCPCYTINCHALDFHISKSQKKVLKKFNEYLIHGIQKSQNHALDTLEKVPDGISDIINYKTGTADTKDLSIETPKETHKVNHVNVNPCPNSSSSGSPKRRKSDTVLTPSQQPSTSMTSQVNQRSKGQKAKFLRIQRKMQKLVSQGLNPEDEMAKSKGPSSLQGKPIEDFVGPSCPDAKHGFEIRTVKVGTQEFDEAFTLEHSLYQKYQMTIHNDEASECTSKQFRRFLCENPLNEVSEDETGCYHQQYYLDDKLIAVGVVDILPTCLSSVYFFYDPAFMNLTLGTFGALREIAFVRERSKTFPDFRFYYMGFYIHSCPKMRYKGNYTPSYLLCPETFKWKLLDDPLRTELNKTKYIAFCSDSSKNQQHENINQVSILYRRSIMPYGIYELQRSKDDTKEIQEYCDLVGAEIAHNLCLYRSLS